MQISNKTKIGIMTVITLALTYWGFNFLKGKDIFNKENTFYVVYERLEGLQASNPIFIKGFKIGQVDDIYFADENNSSFTVVLKVRSDVNIKRSSIARIVSNDLMGNKAIDIQLARTENILKSGDTLRSEIEESLSEQVRLQMIPLKNEAEKLIVDLQKAAHSVSYILNENTGQNLAASFSKIQVAIESFKNVSTSLDTILSSGKGDISRILENFQSISDNLKANNKQIGGILENFKNISDSLSKANLTQTVNNLDSVFVNVSSILAKIENGEGSIGLLLSNDSLYVNLDNTIKSIDNLVKDIEENPKRYVHFSAFGGSKDKPKKVKKINTESSDLDNDNK